MSKLWFTVEEIAAAGSPALPGSARALNRLAERQGWRHSDKARKHAGKGGGWEYHLSLLPGDTQARLTLIHDKPEPGRACDEREAKGEREALWTRFEGLSKPQKAACEARLKAVFRFEELCSAGLGETAATAAAASEAGVSASTLHSWRARLRDLDRADWLAGLAPGYKGKREHAPCDTRAWEVLKSDYLRPEKPGFSACYRRMTQAAKRHGWSPIPSERALRRRLDAEVPAAVQRLAREGRDRAKDLYPAQKRSRGHFHAMQAVNMDGHKLDLFVDIGGPKPVRLFLIGIQDLASGKVLAWRLAESENKDTVRLVIGDMVERHGIPDKIWLDNGRSFASKWISGGTPNRYRFKVRDEDPAGLLTTLGVEMHWTTPYSGQSKPIERAWRDLAEEIAKHPICAGAYTGNKPDAKPENYASKAIDLGTLRTLVADRVAEHNSRPGRRSANCAGRSFDETFAASLAQPGTVVRWPTAAQKSLWLLAAERVRAKKGSGEIHLFGNRYWAPALNQLAGRNVTVRFDPDALGDGVRVYDAADRLVCEAALIGDKRFDDTGAAREHNRNRRAFVKATKEQQALHARLSADELGEIYALGAKPAEPKVERPAIPRIAVARGSAAVKPEPEWDEAREASFSRAIRLIAGRDLEP